MELAESDPSGLWDRSFPGSRDIPFLSSDSGGFKSDKLDMLIVLDTNPDMEEVYKSALFSSSFLHRLKEYDWRLAYTDMSVDMSFLRQTVELEEAGYGKSKSCSILAHLGNVALTVSMAMLEAHYFSVLGIHNIYRCLSRVKKNGKKTSGKCFWKKKEMCKKSFANGAFLPFEYKGEILYLNEFNYLTKSIENYEEIFDHTLRLGNEQTSGRYDAPVQKVHKAYPFVAMILSMAQGGFLSGDTSQNQQESPFFRDDSLIVFVPVTVNDMKYSIPLKEFKSDVGDFFGSEDRVKIIPVTLNADSTLICQISKQVSSSKALKIKELAHQFGSRSLDICSRTLAEDLFSEISKFLLPVSL